MSKSTRWSLRGRILLSVAVFCLSLVVADILLWMVLPMPHPYVMPGTAEEIQFDLLRRNPLNRYLPSYHLPAQLVLHPDPEVIHGVGNTGHVTIDQFGFRDSSIQSIEKPDGELRIIAWGGSTTECIYLDDSETWPTLLHHKLRSRNQSIQVINAGRSGDTTRDHIALLSQRLIVFEPDVVLFLVGINDLTLQARPDYSPIRADSRSIVDLPRPSLRTMISSSVRSVSQIARRIVHVKRGTIKKDRRGNPVQDLAGRWIAEQRQKLRGLPTGSLDLASFPRPEYEENVRTLIGICRAHGAMPVLISQPTIWGAPPGDWEAILWVNLQERHIPHAQLNTALGKYNDVLRSLAAELHVPLIDLAKTLPKTTEFFYDDDHYTVQGAQEVAQQIAHSIVSDPTVAKRLSIRAFRGDVK